VLTCIAGVQILKLREIKCALTVPLFLTYLQNIEFIHIRQPWPTRGSASGQRLVFSFETAISSFAFVPFSFHFAPQVDQNLAIALGSVRLTQLFLAVV
jgi:hypothetical protein